MTNTLNSDVSLTEDPYLWLEEIEGDRAQQWINKQNQVTLGLFDDESFRRDRDILHAIFDRPDKIPTIGRRGEFVYNFWQDADNVRGIWRRTTLDEFRGGSPKWDVIIDLDALAQTEKEDWVWRGPVTLFGSHDRALIYLSRGGSDASVIREFDMEARQFIADGFILPQAKGNAAWLDRDTLILTSAYGGENMQTESGYSRTVRLWKRGDDIDHLPVLFEIDRKSMGVWSGADRTADTEVIWTIEKTGFFSSRYWIGDRAGPKTKLDLPTGNLVQVEHGWFVTQTREEWTVGDSTYAPDTVLGMKFDDFLGGDRDFQVLFEPQERKAFQWFNWVGPRLVIYTLDNLEPVYEFWQPSDAGWSKTIQSGLPKIATVNMWQFDRETDDSNGDMLAMVEDPVTPPTLKLVRENGDIEDLRQAPEDFDASGLVVRKFEAESIDGEMIPYTITGPEQFPDNAPVFMTAYGGFGLSRLPNYSNTVGKLWLEQGGVGVTASIRGGNEFGTRWHDAGRLEGKRLSHDDFAAVASDIVRRGITTPNRIAAQGGSNGGLLITNMLTRYPERFGALFCTIPLIDMRRYTKLLAGASWIEEYGDPDIPEDWAFLQTFSAYQLAKPGQNYPPILLATTTRDDRVHPGHARKMAAKLQEMGYEAHFYEPETGGHGYGKDNAEIAAFTALGFRFLRKTIGWE